MAATPTTMRAWTYTNAGSNLAKALTLNPDAQHPPDLPADKFLIRVSYMSPNPADYKVPELGRLFARGVIPSVPASPGMDYSGTITQIGSGLTDAGYKVGDKVFGRVAGTSFGTLGSYIHAPAPCVAHLPSNISLSDAAALGTAAQTAYQAITPYVTPGRGDQVFINGGSGGVGTWAIQIAAALGCRVTASCSTKNIALCESLGAEAVIDYTTATDAVTTALRAKGQVFKSVLDAVGHSGFDLYKAADDYLLPEGIFVQIGGDMSLSSARDLIFQSLRPAILGGGKRKWKFFITYPSHDHLADLGRLMSEGKIRAVIDGDVYPYEDAPKAFEKLKTGRTRGKLLIKVSDE
ncbi:NAD(P)-binding protein [Xylariaceae sp. FL1272]|nr:NAD(P)-binding protein [Xylariaceae sp. FL1272]